MTKKEKTELQKEVVKAIKPEASGRLLLAPRVGKTKLIIDLIKRDKTQGEILWVTPTSELANNGIPSEFETWRGKKYLKNFKAVTWKSLSKIKGHKGLIILDEEQFMTENNAKTLINKELTYDRLISMTGTQTKYQAKLDLYKRLNLKVLYTITIKTAVDIGLLSNYKINVVRVPLDDHKNIEVKYKDKVTKEDKSFLTSERSQYDYQCRKLETNMTKFGILHRLNLIKNSPSKMKVAKYIFNSLEGRKLLFTANQKQAEALCLHTYHSGTDEKDLKKFISGEISEIAMVNKGGTGYTYKSIDDLVVTQIDSDRNGLTTQKICRTLLGQKNYKANVWIICLAGTQDEVWLEEALKSFDKAKTEFINFKDLQL